MGIETGVDIESLLEAAQLAEEIVRRPLDGRLKRAESARREAAKPSPG
jgi:hypothetical protein